jgi:uncharacterized membrane protein
MKNTKSLLVAIVFFIAAVVFIAFHQSFRFFLPAQQVELSHGVEYGAVVKDFLFVQEITTHKRFLSRIDLYMAKLPSTYANENVFLLINEQHRVLFTKRFSSSDFGEALYFPFDLGKSFDIGSGKKVYACIYSIDGDQGSYIGLAKKQNSNIGQLYVVTILNNDIVQSFDKNQSSVNFTGSIGIRTFETNTRFFSLLQVIFYLLALFISMLIFFSRYVISFISANRIHPEHAFAGISCIFGLILLIITPPFMVPDEAAHFYRSYQVAEFNVFRFNNDVPSALVDFAAKCDRMRFSTHEKTTKTEILSMADIKLSAHNKIPVETPEYTVTYLPQALGIFIGKLLHLNPLWLLYLGRFFNLMVSVLFVFLAIRSTPVLKWLFFLLGIMPMTLYQFSSLSYDALTISLSFLLISAILSQAFSNEDRIGTKQLLVLFLLTGLLAAAKPPYFIIAGAFLVIPVRKLGSRRRYALTFIALISTALVLSQVSVSGRKVLGKVLATNECSRDTSYGYSMEETTPLNLSGIQNSLAASLPLLPHGFSGGQPSEKAPDTTGSAAQQDQSAGGVAPGANVITEAGNPIDPAAQVKFILDNPVEFIGIMFRSIIHSGGFYAIGFVGLFGWVDTPLPGGLAWTYLLFLLLVTIGTPAGKIRITIAGKFLMFGLFLLCTALIETAMYLYCNTVGSASIIAVQGRYFIAIAPVLFLIFQNDVVYNVFRNTGGEGSAKQASKKPMRKETIHRATSNGLTVSDLIPWLAIMIAFATLTYSVFIIFERYYVISM